MITPKRRNTLIKTCSANKETRDVVKAKVKTLPQQQPQPQETPPPVIMPLTTEEKRKQALKAREERLTNLFMSTLKRQIK
jgi:hypothetical protein